MKKILIYVFSTIFLLINCQNKTENILINVKYVGNYDSPMDIVLTNNSIKKDTNVYYQRTYRIKNEKILKDIKNYVVANNSPKIYRINKLKVTVSTKSQEKTYYFNAQDGIKFIDFLIKNVSLERNSENQYSNDEYFKNSELPPFKNQLKAYSGREWMYEKK